MSYFKCKCKQNVNELNKWSQGGSIELLWGSVGRILVQPPGALWVIVVFSAECEPQVPEMSRRTEETVVLFNWQVKYAHIVRDAVTECDNIVSFRDIGDLFQRVACQPSTGANDQLQEAPAPVFHAAWRVSDCGNILNAHFRVNMTVS